MTNLLIAAVGAILATNQPAAVSNLVQATTGLEVAITTTNDPVEQALNRLMQEDDAARAEVEKWVEDNEKFAAQGAGMPPEDMRRRILARLAPVRKGYEELIQQHTNRADVLVAYASYLGDLGEEDAAIEQLEKARGLDARDPAIWNNLANLYGHSGEVTKAFDYYTQAIELNPNEPVYYHNFGTTIFLFRKDAREHYHINEQQVFDRALSLYSNAIRLNPQDFQLAADVAQTFYGIQPPRVDDALRAWTNAFSLADNETDREGVQLHFARIKIKAGRLEEAQAHLNLVTNATHEVVKSRLIRVLQQAQTDALISTNASPAITTNVPGNDP
ncbi:MAG: tetratricopeptide repeat protein [Verrucomicrobiae bacterium]|nr:tetratricopeptide repeat protein [Verrucomicrobiae bacterium]